MHNLHNKVIMFRLVSVNSEKLFDQKIFCETRDCASVAILTSVALWHIFLFPIQKILLYEKLFEEVKNIRIRAM